MIRAELTLIFILCLGLGAKATETIGPVDLLLRGGFLHRGDGEPAEVGDLAIDDGRLIAIGDFQTEDVKHEIDCTGLIVCPGFIDLHNHSDRPILKKSTRSAMNYITQGCTTIVTGNCGSGPIEVDKYYDTIDQYGCGPNVAHLLPHGSLRRTVMGAEQRAATPVELGRMKELAERAMKDGAWGMSTGLIYVPSAYADLDELVELATVAGHHGGIYASHIRNENVELLPAVTEALEIGRRAQVPVHVSHFKSSGKDSWGLVRLAAKMIDKARGEGFRITADQYPYTASSTSLDATLVPTWARSGGREAMLKRLEDEKDGTRIRDAVAKKLTELDDGHRIQIAFYKAEPSWAGKRLAEIAHERSTSALDTAIDILRMGGASIVNHSINEDDVRYVMTLPWVATASDGSAKLPGATVPHPRSYGTFPRKLGHYSIHEKAVSIEWAIRSSTGLPADILGMVDRGYLRPNYWADVVAFDPKTIRDTATFEQPHSYSSGIRFVFVNGQTVISRGAPTGVLAGRALRHSGPDTPAETRDVQLRKRPSSDN